MTAEERVREEIAEQFYLQMVEFHECPSHWKSMSEGQKDEFRRWADQILSIKGILIKADDQSLPFLKVAQCDPNYSEAQQDMLKEGFVRKAKK